ncbi:Transmembrane protein 18 [Phlyctochytrium planicorne]|nr:Transmembrane protein 18 [Phlyctochytrium planicorne]
MESFQEFVRSILPSISPLVSANEGDSRNHGSGRHEFSFGDQDSMKRALEEFMQDSKHFINVVNWTEPLIVGILTFHLLIFVWVLAIRKNHNLLVSTLVFLGGSVFASEPVNSYLRENHELVSEVNYFDAGGVFMAVLVLAPIVVNMVLIVIFMLRVVVDVMAVVKGRQIKAKMVASQRSKEGEVTEGNVKGVRRRVAKKTY